jgi:hypothetical protein
MITKNTIQPALIAQAHIEHRRLRTPAMVVLVILYLRNRVAGLKHLIINLIIKFTELDDLNKRENQIHPAIRETLKLVDSTVKVNSYSDNNHQDELGTLFSKYGSDKHTRHSYSWVYRKLLTGLTSPRILEIGVGSRNGYAYGGLPPGGSLKAWRAAYPNAFLVGADIDAQSILELDELGFVVDQLDQDSLTKFELELNKIEKFNLIIDDGFHEPHANLKTYLSLFQFVETGGFYVIEDIHESFIDFWRIIGELIPGELTIYDLRNQRPACEDNILLVFAL